MERRVEEKTGGLRDQDASRECFFFLFWEKRIQTHPSLKPLFEEEQLHIYSLSAMVKKNKKKNSISIQYVKL